MNDDRKIQSECRHEHTNFQALPVTSFLTSWLGLNPSVMVVEVCQDCGACRIVGRYKMKKPRK